MIPQRTDRREPPEAPSAAPEGPTLDLSESDGTVVVKIRDGTLSTAEDISAFEAEVGHLLDAGYERIAMDFSEVSQLSRRGVKGLIRVQQRFRQAGVGLKLRAVQPQVAAGLGLANADPPSVELPVDERPAAANGAAKTAASAPHEAVGRTPSTNGHAQPVVRHPAPAPRTGAFVQPAFDFVASGAMYVDPTTVHEFDIAEILGSLPASAPPAPVAASEPRRAPSGPAGGAAGGLSHVRLRVRSGSAAGQTIEVRGPKFTIGRDGSCHLRAKSSFVSRVHASIAQRGGRVFVRDEVSSNGTTVNGRLLRDEEVEVADGDRLDIGPMQFTIAIVREPTGPGNEGSLAVDEAPAPPALAPADADFWSGVQFTCAVQPGSLVRLNAPPAVRTEAAPVTAASGAAAWPGGGRAALEHMLHQLLRMLGNGGAAAEAPAAEASPPRARGRAAAPPPPAKPAPPAEPAAPNAPGYAVTMERGEPSAADLPLYVRDAGTSAFDDEDEEPETPSAASGVGLDIERLLAEAEVGADPSDHTPTTRHEPRLDTELASQRALEIQFDCPNCGEPGQVPISRMGSLFRCNTCQTDFRIDASGTRSLRQELQPRAPIWKKVAAAAAVLVLLFVGHAVANSSLFFGSPAALTSYTLKALTQDKPERVLAIAAGGTTRTTRRWLRNVGPILKSLSQRAASTEIAVVSSGDTFAETSVAFRLDPSDGSAKAEDANAGKAGPRAPTNGEQDEKGVVKVSIRWVKSHGTWYLDGRTTLRRSSKLTKQYAAAATKAR